MFNVPAQCWTGATALARLTQRRCSHCCLCECDSRLTPVEQGRGGSLSEDSRKYQYKLIFFIARGELYLQKLCAVLQISLAALQSVLVVTQDCEQSLYQTQKRIKNNTHRQMLTSSPRFSGKLKRRRHLVLQTKLNSGKTR